MNRMTFVAAQAVGLLVCAVLSATAFAKQKLPEVSSDGLHLVPDTEAYAVYAKPGATISQYDKVMLLDCFVQFKDNYQRDYNMEEIGLQGRITTKDMENIKQALAAEFRKVFTEELQKGGQEVVDAPGPDVLLLRPAIINLDVTSPDLPTAGFSRTYVTSAGQMTLYMEMYDSATSELLARVIDPQEGDRGGIGFQANRVTNTMEARQILTRWADLLSKHLAKAQQPAASQ